MVSTICLSAGLVVGCDKFTAGTAIRASSSQGPAEAAQFCGYSGQLLTGTFHRASAFDFADRITHIWTNTTKYLVAIQLQGPAGAAGFGAAKSVLMQEFAVVMP